MAQAVTQTRTSVLLSVVSVQHSRFNSSPAYDTYVLSSVDEGDIAWDRCWRQPTVCRDPGPEVHKHPRCKRSVSYDWGSLGVYGFPRLSYV